jgi:hypothetical protein
MPLNCNFFSLEIFVVDPNAMLELLLWMMMNVFLLPKELKRLVQISKDLSYKNAMGKAHF